MRTRLAIGGSLGVTDPRWFVILVALLDGWGTVFAPHAGNASELNLT